MEDSRFFLGFADELVKLAQEPKPSRFDLGYRSIRPGGKGELPLMRPMKKVEPKRPFDSFGPGGAVSRGEALGVLESLRPKKAPKVQP